MTRRMLTPTVALMALGLALLLCAGCGSKEAEQTQATQEAEAPAAATEHPAAEHPAAEAGEAVATHDCAGGCGMTNVPEDQLTELHGQWFCAGCAKKHAEEHKGHG